MADPQRVRGFLDLFGTWDPTLAFVMGGALIPMAIAWRVQKRMPTPMAAERFTLPTARDLDPRLIGGSALFGIGWGVAGLCPGPAIADLAIAPVPAAIFVVAMLGGMSGAIAHELNQPLTAILSNADAGRLLIDRGRLDPSELRDILGDIAATPHSPRIRATNPRKFQTVISAYSGAPSGR
jgi:uncharacterized membrane protein YedE/YeeE